MPAPVLLATVAEPGALGRIEEVVNSVFEPLTVALSDFVFAEVPVFGAEFPWIVAWLVIAAIVFTVYFGFVQFRAIPLALNLVRGRFSRDSDPGEITHFQALSSAMSATVGLGNIAGVGVAVTLGGPGATFWMIIAGLLGMCTKFVECTLGVRYREIHADGTVSGGPMHYLRKGVAERLPGRAGVIIGSVLAGVAAVFVLFFALGGGNMFQANQTFAQLRSVTGGDTGPLGGDSAALIFGLILAGLVGVVIIGGIRSIAKVTSKLVPGMAIMYVAACLVVIIANADQVPAAFGAIIDGAFTGAGVAGGVLGALIVGFQRAAFSNEAGLGSAPIAHSAVKTRHPITEGYVSLLEPFVDTVIICTMTALTIIIASTPLWVDGRAAAFAGEAAPDGVVVTSDAFASVLPGFEILLTVAVVLFAVSTMLTWGYYGQKAWTYLFGRSAVAERIYQVIYLVFIVIGSVLTLGAVLDFTDAVLFLLALVNIAGLYLLSPYVKQEIESFRRARESGEVTDRSRR